MLIYFHEKLIKFDLNSPPVNFDSNRLPLSIVWHLCCCRSNPHRTHRENTNYRHCSLLWHPQHKHPHPTATTRHSKRIYIYATIAHGAPPHRNHIKCREYTRNNKSGTHDSITDKSLEPLLMLSGFWFILMCHVIHTFTLYLQTEFATNIMVML